MMLHHDVGVNTHIHVMYSLLMQKKKKNGGIHMMMIAVTHLFFFFLNVMRVQLCECMCVFLLVLVPVIHARRHYAEPLSTT